MSRLYWLSWLGFSNIWWYFASKWWNVSCRFWFCSWTLPKHPPIKFLQHIFTLYGLKEGRCTVRCDKGGELWDSYELHTVVQQAHYVIQLTALDAPFQNGLAERPEQTLGTMMHCMLHKSNLGPEFWSFALVLAVKIYYMLPHSATGMTPHFAFTNQRSSISNMHIWGCRVYA